MIILGSVGFLLFTFIFKPKTVPQESIDLANAVFRFDTNTIENHLFDSEKKRYSLDDKKRNALSTILKRAMSKIKIIKLHSPEYQKQVGSGAIWISYICNNTGRQHEGLMPSYLTPDGVHTGLLDVLMFVWVAEFYNDISNSNAKIPDLLKALKLGLSVDAESLKSAGFREISQDGLTFVSIDALIERTNKHISHFEGASSAR